MTEDNNLSKVRNYVKKIRHTVKNLEENLRESNEIDHEKLMSNQIDKIKFQGLSSQLEEAQKENKELLNILQQKCSEHELSRSNSQIDISGSCSTMSIVHLQYKYDELLANHNCLLKLLDVKTTEIKKLHEENCRLKEEIEERNAKLTKTNHKITSYKKKIAEFKDNRNAKITKLECQNEALQLAHNRVVDLLHARCMEEDRLYVEKIKTCKDPYKAQLLQEIRKNNMLSYENFQLNQEIDFLKNSCQNDVKPSTPQQKI